MTKAGLHAQYPAGVEFPAVSEPVPVLVRHPRDSTWTEKMLDERRQYALRQKGFEIVDRPAPQPEEPAGLIRDEVVMSDAFTTNGPSDNEVDDDEDQPPANAEFLPPRDE